MQSVNRKNSIVKLLLLVWSILCLCVFIFYPGRVNFLQWANIAEWQYFPAKLERINFLHYFLTLVRSFVGVTLYSLAGISFGIFITKAFHVFEKTSSPSYLTRLAIFSTNFLIGHGFISLVLLSLGGLYKLTPILVAVVLVIGFISGINSLKKYVPNLYGKVHIDDHKNRVIFWLSISVLLLTVLQSSARISYDSSAIYFSNAKLTAITNRIQFFTDGTFVASVFQTAIQYTALIQLFGDQVARMFSWIFGIVIVVFSLALGERIGLSKQARTIMLALLLTTTAFIDLLGDGKVDLNSSAPAIAAIYWMIVHSQNQPSRKSTLLLIGFLTGLAIIGRPFNAYLLGIFITLFYFQRSFLSSEFASSRLNSFVSSMFWIGMGVIGLGLYHLFANWMILGNPLAFLSSYTSINSVSGPWDADQDQLLVFRLLYPLVATFRNTPQSLGNISPLFVAFLPAIFIANIRKKLNFSRELLILTTISVATLILWIYIFFTVVELRYVLFLWIVLFIPMAEIINLTLDSGDRLFQNMMGGVVVTLLIFINIRTLFISLDSYSPIDRQGNPQCYDLVFCEYLKPINQAANLGDRVLMLGAYRYYLRSDLFECSTKHDEYKILFDLSYQSPKAFWMEVYRRGYKFIAYENDYTVRHLRFGIVPDVNNVPNWIRLEPIFGESQGLVVAYQIDFLDFPADIEYSCTKSADGKWQVQKIDL